MGCKKKKKEVDMVIIALGSAIATKWTLCEDRKRRIR